METAFDDRLVTQAPSEMIDARVLFTRVQHALLNLIPAHLNALVASDRFCPADDTLTSRETFTIPPRTSLGWIEVVLADPTDPTTRVKLRLRRWPSQAQRDRFSDLSISFGTWEESEKPAYVQVAARAGDWRGTVGSGANKAWLHRSHTRESTEDVSIVSVPKWVGREDQTYRIRLDALPDEGTLKHTNLRHAYDIVNKLTQEGTTTIDASTIDRILWAQRAQFWQPPGIRKLVRTFVSEARSLSPTPIRARV